MDLNKLRKLTQEGKNDLEKEVLRYCNPQEIAQQLMKEIQIKAAKAAKEGETSTCEWFHLWTDARDEITPRNYGPLATASNRHELSEALFGMVKRYITDEHIQLELKNDNRGPLYTQRWIVASVEW